MNIKQQEIITALGSLPNIDPSLEIDHRSHFLADYLEKTNLGGYILGISGGQDSLLAGLLAQKAVQLRRKSGAQAEFHAILLPYGRQTDRADAELALNTIAPDVTHDIDIKPAVDAFSASFAAAENHPLSDFDKGNVKARMRMITQYATAGEHRLLVIGTDHAAESITGFYTKYGDGGADILPLAGLTKRQGRAMLVALCVPGIFITKKPTADLLDSHAAQPDETELGISYDMIDDYLEGREVPPEIATQIEARYWTTAHKRALPVAYGDK